ncbi:MAG: peptidoglycan-binding protein [Candidatus Staskawiczbacteria bacterium]|nr:peptidoglycan-binding protein [Candidatus Staskawiczbacteria bacterium]
MNSFKLHKKIIFLAGLFLFLSVQFASATNFSDVVNFNVDSSFDALGRSQITAVLLETSPKLYIYVDKSWWDAKLQSDKEVTLANLGALSTEFENNIYPTLTSVFGSEWKPGVDGNERVTLLFEPMNSNEGGYFRTTDEYIKLQLPESNEREMVYLSIDQINSSKAKVVLAHEFMHLITFNQKNKILGIDEEVWLNEARADYSSNILGYDNDYHGSNLQSRVRDFVENPSDSITEWKGTKYDYASASLFAHYLVDHFGITVLSDSLKSKYVGIESINYALEKMGYEERFPEIFTDWTVAAVVNDCSLGFKYCYLNKNLTNFRLSPALNFLPVTGNVSLSVTNVTKNWSGNWLKFIGGNGDLKFGFSSLAGINFQVPYILENKFGEQFFKFLVLNSKEKGEISVPDFGTDYKSLIVIPSLQTKISGFDGLEFTYPFTYSVSITGSEVVEDQALIQKLLDQIAYLKAEIAKLLGTLPDGQTSCEQLNSNLSIGMSNDDVSCLQTFLKSQGSDIYPEGLVTGYFGSLTKNAVIRFQQKYASEVLSPLELYYGTGYVGVLTRAKINQLLTK